jgi:hypothetical protein
VAAVILINNSKHAKNERGSALIEALPATAVLSLLISGGIALGYFVFAKVWLTRSAYEASICLSTSAPTQDCESHLKNDVGGALPIGTIGRLHVTRNQSEVRVEFDWQLTDEFKLHIEDERELPLHPAATSRRKLTSLGDERER